MKWWLTVFFMVNGTWIRGDHFDGWSPRQFETEQDCIIHKSFAERECFLHPLEYRAVWVCSYASPATSPPAAAIPEIEC